MFEFDPKVAHLLRRATLGPTYLEVARASEAGLAATLDSLVSQIDRPPTRQEMMAAAIGGAFLRDARTLRAGWMLRMLSAPSSLREKLTLFWHGHFATAIAKVGDPALMARQVDVLREMALGSFRDMVLEMSRDPAMLIWLDNALNVKGAPNENFARELMELFTLGIGHYSERDVQEVARAFTGWTLDGRSFRFDPSKHDDGEKTVLGRSGRLDGKDVVDHICSLPRTPRFIAWKLWSFFVGTEPAEEDLAAMSGAYFDSGTQVGPMLKAMFRSPRFFEPAAVGTRVKGPVEFVVGLVRSLEAPADGQVYADAAASIGQDLYNPPDVNGWPGGEQWISTYTLLERIRLVRRLVGQGRDDHVCGLDIRKVISENLISENEELVDHMLLRFLHRRPAGPLRRTLLEFLAAGVRGRPTVRLGDAERQEKIRGLIRLILCSQEYQLC